MMIDKAPQRLTKPFVQQWLSPFWCTSCAHLVKMIPAEEAKFILRAGTERINEGIERKAPFDAYVNRAFDALRRLVSRVILKDEPRNARAGRVLARRRKH